MSVSTVGELYMVATPIGNLEDITLRALRVLRRVDIIAAEDTRRASILLRKYSIRKKVVSYHIHNEHGKTARLLDEVEKGLKLAVLSDAGTPCVADPGFLMMREAVARGVEAEIIPGVSALTFSVVACGFPVNEFAFFGFPPEKGGKRRGLFEKVAREGRTAFFFVSPHKMEKVLGDAATVFGSAARAAVIREATKAHEEVLRGDFAEIIEAVGGRKWRGECVLAVCPAKS